MCVIIFTIVYNIIFFFYLAFLSRTFIHESQGCRGRGRAFFKLLTTTSLALGHYPGNYCRELTSAHSLQPDSNWESLVSERKSLTTKLRALKYKVLLKTTV